MFRIPMLFRFLLVACVCTVMSCKDCDDPNNRDCPNYRDCSPFPVIKADFQTRGGHACNGRENLFMPLSDTMLFGPGFRMYGQPSGGSYYEYRLGTDPRRFNTQNHCSFFTLADSTNIINRPFPIRFIVHKTPKLDCNPRDDGRDTIVKNVYFFTPTQAQYLGAWEGKFDDEPMSEMRRIQVKGYKRFSQDYYFEHIYIKNFLNNGGKDSTIIYKEEATYFGYSQVTDTINGAVLAYQGHLRDSVCNSKNVRINSNQDSIKIIIYPLRYSSCPYPGRKLYFRGRRVS